MRRTKTVGPYLEVVNRSTWPSAAVRVLAEWVCGREGIGTPRHPYRVIVRGTKLRTLQGTGTREWQNIRIHRRYNPAGGWPRRWRDWRFSFAEEEIYYNRIECLVALMAHEAHHATDGHPSKWVDARGRVRRAEMEFECNRRAQQAAVDLRGQWEELKERIVEEMRLERQARRRRRVRMRLAVAA